MQRRNNQQISYISDALGRIIPAEPGLLFSFSGPAIQQGRLPLRKKGWQDNMTSVASMANTLQAAQGVPHRYMSMSLFHGAGRTTEAFACAPAGWVDLDHNKLGDADPLRGLDDAGVIAAIQTRCAASGLPMPTLIISSGGGHYAIWFWAAPVFDGDALEEFNRGAIAAFHAFGADRAAWDRSRVLRIPGSINAKYDHAPVVRVTHQAVGADGDALRHDFDAALAAVRAMPRQDTAVLDNAPQPPVSLTRGRFAPVPVPQRTTAKVFLMETARRRSQAVLAKQAATTAKGKKAAGISFWRNLVLDDIVAVTKARIERGRTDPAWAAWTEAHGIPEGMRDIMMVPVHALLSLEVPAAKLEEAVLRYASWIVDEAWLRTEWIGRKFQGSCQRRAFEAEAGKTRTFTRADGAVVEVDPRYTYTTARICDIWAITNDEIHALGLKGLVTRQASCERWNARRRNEVRIDRPNHVPTGMAKADLDDRRRQRDAEVAALREQGLSIRKIADALGMPRSTVADAVERNQRVVGCPEWAMRTNVKGWEVSVPSGEERVDSLEKEGVDSPSNSVRCAREAVEMVADASRKVVPFVRPMLRGSGWLQDARHPSAHGQVAVPSMSRVLVAPAALARSPASEGGTDEYAALRGAYQLMSAMEGDQVEIDFAARRLGVPVAVLRAALVENRDHARQGRWDWRGLRQNAVRRAG